MKLISISNGDAETILTNGEDKSFTMFEYQETLFTIYHRTINGKIYDIVEFTGKNDKGEEVSEFKLLDHNEVTELLQSKEV